MTQRLCSKEIVKNLEIGEVYFNELEEIYKVINKFYKLWIDKKLDIEYFYDELKIREFSWQHQAQKLLNFMKNFKI